MKLTKAILGVAAGAMLTTGFALQAQAEDKLFIPLLTYRTGAFAGSGTPNANGMHDLFTMLNVRDGGIGGVKIQVEECETGYKAQKGVECYEAMKGKGALVFKPLFDRHHPAAHSEGADRQDSGSVDGLWSVCRGRR